MTAGHRQAMEELQRIHDADPNAMVIANRARKPEHGWLKVEVILDYMRVSVDAKERRLKPREYVTIVIPDNFPYVAPVAMVRHSRFAGLPHVLWGRVICLYLGADDWDPAQGMFGFIERLDEWYVRAAHGALEPVGLPPHPPLVYPVREAGHVVIAAELPDLPSGRPWVGQALLHATGPYRTDVVDWQDGAGFDDEAARRLFRRVVAAAVRGRDSRVTVGPVIVLPTPLDFEFPRTVADLVAALAERGVPENVLVSELGLAAWINSRGFADSRPPTPLHAFIGAPMLGLAGEIECFTHLAAWRLNEREAYQAVTAILPRISEDPEVLARRRQLDAAFTRWIDSAEVSWASVHDQRPSVVLRRDHDRPARWLRDRRVLLLGCGALGARIAEHCVRAGVAGITLADSDIVTAGVLVRQPYVDRDVGILKAAALAARLLEIRHDLDVEPVRGDILRTLLDEPRAWPKIDLVIDATASQAVAARIEALRHRSEEPWPPILSVGVGHDCERGVATLALPGATGAGSDILHRLGDAAALDPDLRDVAKDFFGAGDPNGRAPFQPEPGCSEPTFSGADYEVAALAGQLFGWGVATLRAHALGAPITPRSAYVARLPTPAEPVPSAECLEWPNDKLVNDPDTGYQIRITPEALETMRCEALTTAQTHGPTIETGGMLLGRIDDACRVVYVTYAESPPPDSERSTHRFSHGLQGVEQLVADYRLAGDGRIRFVGMWHTHPGGGPAPSKMDQNAMEVLLVPTRQAPPRAILLIVGGGTDVWREWLQDVDEPQLYARLISRTITISETETSPA
ncbi:ThiF family adenylyltransferase [Actinomadura sp. DC4]|uniref:ThiF family adenylyltransferase n=1 Tax=Actinomadura sp. DC4 TaxID=3055069 RepID=UPI0025AEE24E|nr:ThiF family adenylyltransferase [Actinomadura sp. DC4]MDN3357641.1 ThiF family adenylyltransferase [Actinomadura sp. DC4]